MPILYLSLCSLSFTDAEHDNLGQLAASARLGRSEYIIEKLGVDK